MNFNHYSSLEELDTELIQVLKLTNYEYDLVFKHATKEQKMKLINDNSDRTPERIVKQLTSILKKIQA